MKKLLVLAFISLVTFIPQLHCISLDEYIQQNGMPQIQGDVLNLSGINLTDLTRLQDIPNINQITTLALSNNQLQTLPANIFNGLQNLRELYIDNNQLQTLPANIFNGLQNLNHLGLSNNQLQTLPDTIFNGLQNLIGLGLNNNQLQTLPADIFNGLNSLTGLYLGNNQLQTLPADIFIGLHNLRHIFLANNQLQTLPADIFNNFDQLTVLNLKYNPFTPDFIPTLNNMIRNIPNLKYLNAKDKNRALKEQPFVTLKTLMAENIAKNLDAYRHRLHELPSDVLNLLPLTEQERAAIEQRRAGQ